MNKKKYIFILLFVLFSEFSKSQSVEYFVKASLIEKFARFTEWGAADIGKTFVIGVLGESPFYSELDDMGRKTKIKDRPVKITYFKKLPEIKECQLLFICSSEKDNVSELVKYFQNKNVLLVGDTPGFSELGVHFNFYFKPNNTIHFEINIKTLEKSNMKPDIHLLSIGKITN